MPGSAAQLRHINSGWHSAHSSGCCCCRHCVGNWQVLGFAPAVGGRTNQPLESLCLVLHRRLCLHLPRQLINRLLVLALQRPGRVAGV